MRFISTPPALAISLLLGLGGCNSADTSSAPQDGGTAVETPAPENNDTLFTDPELNAYYATALEQNGSALKAALHAIVRTATRLSYDEVYILMTESDRDMTNLDENDIVLFYSRRAVPADDKCHTDATGCWNREHLWPKSLGVGYDDTVACYTDMHHLYPADAQVNRDRSNRRFAPSSTPYPGIDGLYYDDASWSWEPQDAIKGDVARALLYMTVRYEGEGNEPDLELLPHDDSAERPADLCTMLAWNRLDPVSSREQRRNDTVYFYQENRNPFIDRPEWADDLYAAACE